MDDEQKYIIEDLINDTMEPLVNVLEWAIYGLETSISLTPKTSTLRILSETLFIQHLEKAIEKLEYIKRGDVEID